MENKIDRRALVKRHNPVLNRLDPLSPLSVGNGQFAFTADLTGLQSFPQHYEVPLGTQSEWGWHSSGGPGKYSLRNLRLQPYESHGRQVGYAIDDKGQEEPFHWLRQNPHRLQLGQIGLRLFAANGHSVELRELHEIEQRLDMWNGVLVSRFKVDGIQVCVRTVCHPEMDKLGVRIESELLTSGRLEVTIGFPSPLPTSREWANSVGLNWGDSSAHETRFIQGAPGQGVFERSMDQDGYSVNVVWSHGQMAKEEAHRFRLIPGGAETSFDFTLQFAPGSIPAEMAVSNHPAPLPHYVDIERASAAHWERFWLQGGAVELAGSRDTRAWELERRIVLSQFLTAIHCAGTLPPQETGLLYSSWFGKFHLEMHWWHAVHFALWGRTHLLRKSLDWYIHILPEARKLAGSQGYDGARWPKMVGPEGRDSPSPIGPLLIWQQPHPIVYAELCYLAEPAKATLDYFHDVVMETAAFMASFAVWQPEEKRYVLGPPVIPAQEEHPAGETLNPAFELEYWRHGLILAQQWRMRLGLFPEPKWQHICDHLSELPTADGVYIAHENAPDTFRKTNTDHPSMLGALGMLPGGLVDRVTMNNTLHKVMNEWQWDTSWGWDFPMTAMTAARLGDGAAAVDALLMDAQKNTYLPSGHNYQREGLTAYLPGNGGLLTAVALMACGWQGRAEQAEADQADAPGFPRDGSWSVKWEGLNAWL
ncbi:glycoside hydrolase family 65 [Paenibacillus abyssi]|uniref:Glycoside hydrolase family 65 n=1 Tax=Paenibacillus abyssi TaxID=1340531 RepID=A0A917D0Y8_9BACL|nr:glycoside hydrolase family 65 [Paenibacillus abyssi]GGG03438.1 hypothetical protein GCM10010916_20680 [Paenibacillus abyssi]